MATQCATTSGLSPNSPISPNLNVLCMPDSSSGNTNSQGKENEFVPNGQ